MKGFGAALDEHIITLRTKRVCIQTELQTIKEKLQTVEADISHCERIVQEVRGT